MKDINTEAQGNGGTYEVNAKHKGGRKKRKTKRNTKRNTKKKMRGGAAVIRPRDTTDEIPFELFENDGNLERIDSITMDPEAESLLKDKQPELSLDFLNTRISYEVSILNKKIEDLKNSILQVE